MTRKTSISSTRGRGVGRRPPHRPTGTSSAGKRKGFDNFKSPAFFRVYLKNIKSAKRFISQEGAHYLQSHTTWRRSRIMKRIREVDPEGYLKVRR